MNQVMTKPENFIAVPLSGFEATERDAGSESDYHTYGGYSEADFDVALKAFLADAKAKSDARFAAHYPSLVPATFSIEPGSKNIRVVISSSGSRSVHCFVRKSDGAILKAAGWKAPFIAKGGPNAPMTIRGSIFDPTTFNPSRWA